MDKTLRFLLIGCGRISKTHIAASTQTKWMELVAVCDQIPAFAKICAENYLAQSAKECGIYLDYKKALQELDIDVCVIATESGYHADIARDCIIAGKHVLIEKPMALSTKDAEDLIEKAKAANVRLGVCLQNRFNPPIIQLRKAIDAKRFGKLVHGTARILWNRTMPYYEQAPWRGTWKMDGGTLMNQCIHNIDLLQWSMGGEPDTIMAMTGNYLHDIEAEDFGSILIRFKNGAIGIIEGSACVYPKSLEETLSIFGETGTVVIGGIAVNRIETWNFERSAVQDQEIEDLFKSNIKNVYGSGHTPLYANFIHAVHTNTDPFVSGEEGIKGIKITLAAYRSQKTGLPVKYDDLDFSTFDMSNKDIRYLK